DFSNPIFHNDEAAREYIESLRWADGRFCPHCGEAERTSHVSGEKHRPGLYVCLSCKRTFTVTVGTVMERSHIPLHKWVAAFVLLTASKKGVSAHQVHRMLAITYKSAWFMCHRIREAMKGRAFPGRLVAKASKSKSMKLSLVASLGARSVKARLISRPWLR